MLHSLKFLAKGRFLAIALLALSAVAIFACGDDDDATPTATATTAAASATTGGGGSASTVKVGDNTFTPGTITVAKGAKVTWDFAGASNPHGVIGTSDNAKTLLKSETFTGSGTYEVTMADAGTYDYQCSIHGAAMPGKVVVQ